MATLRYLDDKGQTHTHELGNSPTLIGRATTCPICIDSEMISREHARIEGAADGRFRATDLGSRNKTFVNGEQITERVLSPGDVLRIGDSIFEFVDESQVASVLDMEFITPEKGEPPGAVWVKIKQPVSLTIAQLERISQIGADLALTARVEDVASSALGRVILDLNAERGFIALRGDKKTDLRPLAHRGLARAPGASRTPVCESFVVAPILQQVAGGYPESARQIDKKLGYAVTALVAPLTDRGEVIGVLYVDRPAGKRTFPTADVAYAIAAGAHVGSLLGATLRNVARVAVREGAAWLTNLRRVQKAIESPAPPGETFQVATKCFAGRTRCGDFIWVRHFDSQRCAVLLTDGGGHGLAGLAQAAMIRGGVAASLLLGEDAVMDPAPVFNAVNTLLGESSWRQVVPITYAALDLSLGKLAYINAGGPPPLLMLGAGRLLTLDQSSLVLGVDRDYAYQATRVDLPDLFRCVCYTDGLLDAAGASGEALGSERLHHTLLDGEAFGAADEVLSRIEQLWKTHVAGAAPDDDATVLVIARGGAPP